MFLANFRPPPDREEVRLCEQSMGGDRRDQGYFGQFEDG